MDINRPLVRFAALGAAGAMVLAAAPAMARPAAKPGKVNNVKIAVADIALGGTAYSVPASWSASTKTTDYQVKLVNSAGTVLNSNSGITATQWTARTNADAGTMVRVVVTPFNGTRKGQPAQSNLVPLPDLSAPMGTFSMSKADKAYKVTLSQLTLADNVTAQANISKVVHWGDGVDTDWNGSSSLDHTYATPNPITDVDRYTASITLSDTATPANSVTLPLGDVVVNDFTPPTGTFAVASSSAWTSYSPVSLTESAVDDGAGSPANNIERTVSWGDGSSDSWTSGAVPTHVYSTDGLHHVTVTLTDEAGNVSDPIPAGDVTSATDATAPAVKFKYPAKPRNVAKKWRTLRGTVTDAGVGAKQVQLKVIEKRGRAWYSYKPGTHRWVKAGTVRKAWTKAGLAKVTPSATGTWAQGVAGVRKGTLTYRAKGVDNVGNASGWLAHSQKLTR